MWARYWHQVERFPIEEQLRKVLVQMRAPAVSGDVVEPIACVWDLLHPNGTLEPWFAMAAAGPFAQLHWFSMSAYLRTLLRDGQSEIELAMPLLEARLDVVGTMIPATRRSA